MTKMVELKVGDLVGIKEYGGYWNRSKWIEDKTPSYWFGTISEIKNKDDVPHFGEPECCIKIVRYEPDTGRSDYWSWEKREDIYFVKRDFVKKFNKVR